MAANARLARNGSYISYSILFRIAFSWYIFSRYNTAGFLTMRLCWFQFMISLASLPFRKRKRIKGTRPLCRNTHQPADIAWRADPSGGPIPLEGLWVQFYYARHVCKAFLAKLGMRNGMPPGIAGVMAPLNFGSLSYESGRPFLIQRAQSASRPLRQSSSAISESIEMQFSSFWARRFANQLVPIFGAKAQM